MAHRLVHSSGQSSTDCGVGSKQQRTRVMVDGCFDMIHYAHLNLMRRAKALGDELVVAIHSDKAILAYKGPTLFTEEERYYLAGGVKWTDEVAEDAPVRITVADPLDKHNCDFIVHGDDLAILDGKDLHEPFKRVGRFRCVMRTPGISSTAIVARLVARVAPKNQKEDRSQRATDFVLSSTLFRAFAEDQREPNLQPGDRICYCAGSFDLFHIGHLKFLEEARKLGDYLIVGVFSDDTVKGYKGKSPIMNVQERLLTVMGFRPVSQVLIHPPLTITKKFLDQFNVSTVCHGTATRVSVDTEQNPYMVAQQMGIFRWVDSQSPVTTELLIDRVLRNRKAFGQRNLLKGASSDDD